MPGLSPGAVPARARRSAFLCAVLLALAACAAWHNSFSVPFVLDDLDNIATNPSIRHLSDLADVLSPPSDIGFGGRPVLNLSFALNYAATGLTLRDLHATNLLLHLCAGLALFGLVRRTLLSAPLRARYGDVALPLAFAVALLWTLHPVQTASVTYLSQRAESLMGLFYLLTLYCFVRAAECGPVAISVPPSDSGPSLGPAVPATTGLNSPGSDPTGAHLAANSAANLSTDASSPVAPATSSAADQRLDRHRLAWFIASVAACVLGMGTKEVMATAPLAVLLYDRTFLAGTFRAALRARPRFYLALALTWTLVALSLADIGARGVGARAEVTRLDYAFTECRAVAHYLSLAFWPDPLVFAYGADFIRTLGGALPYALVLAPLLALTIVALVRWPAVGFVGAWFFGILAPTSSILPIAYLPVAENRLYLPLAAVIVAAVLALHAWLGRRAIWVAWALAPVLLALTERRNADYRSVLALWADTVEKAPTNPQALYNYGFELSRTGQNAAAAAQWRAALRRDPAHLSALDNLANTLVALGRTDEALRLYAEVLHRQPSFSALRANYGLVLTFLGRTREAEAQLRLAVRQSPASAVAHHNLGLLLDRTNRTTEAIAAYEAALKLDADFANAHFNLGIALARLDRVDEAAVQLKTAARLRPNDADALLTLSRVYLQAKRLPESQTAAADAVRLFPGSAEAHLALGNALTLQGQLPAAAAEFERALLIQPDFPAARDNLAIVRARLPR